MKARLELWGYEQAQWRRPQGETGEVKTSGEYIGRLFTRMGLGYISMKHLGRKVDLYFNFHEIESITSVPYIIFLGKSSSLMHTNSV